ncbi:MAG: TldD/PmbA family protein [Candidatus Thermoplasmatota archaeon]
MIEICERAINLAQRAKADSAEAFGVKCKIFTVRIVNSRIFEAKGIQDSGVGLRVIKNGGLGFSTANEFSNSSLTKIIENCLRLAKFKKLGFKYDFPSPRKSKPKVSYHKKLAELAPEEVIGLAKRMIESATNFNTKIKDVAGTINVVEYYINLINTNGVNAKDKGTMLEASLTSTAKDGTVAEGADSHGYRYLKDFSPEEIGKASARMAIDSLSYEKLIPKEYVLVLDPGALVDILHFLGYLISPLYQKIYSPLLTDKLGKNVASEFLTIYDDATFAQSYGATNIDDEGMPTVKLSIVKNGLLQNFVYDSFYAAKENKKPTGNAYRAGAYFPGRTYLSEPLPLAKNLRIEIGDAKREEIIQETKDGLLAMRSHYPRITNPIRGDYTTIFRQGLYRIKNGEIVGAVQKSRLIDNILSLLKRIDLIGNNLTSAGCWGHYLLVPSVRVEKARVVPV